MNIVHKLHLSTQLQKKQIKVYLYWHDNRKISNIWKFETPWKWSSLLAICCWLLVKAILHAVALNKEHCGGILHSQVINNKTHQLGFQRIQVLPNINIGTHALYIKSSLLFPCQLRKPLDFSRDFCVLWIVLQSCLKSRYCLNNGKDELKIS